MVMSLIRSRSPSAEDASSWHDPVDFNFLRHRAAAYIAFLSSLQPDLQPLVAGLFVSGLVRRNGLGAETSSGR